MATFPSFKVKAPKQSNHNRSHYYRGSFGVGPIYPVKTRLCLPGDIIDTSVEALVNTQALLTPKYGSFELKVEAFFAPLDLYIPSLRFSRDLYDIQSGQVDSNFPRIILPRADDSRGLLPVGKEGVRYSTWRAEANSLLSFLGLGPGWTPAFNEDTQDTVGESFNGIPFLIYYDIIRTYYANQQKETFTVINKRSASSGNLPGVFTYSSVSRSALDVVYSHDLNQNTNFVEAFRNRLSTSSWLDGVELGFTLSGLALRNFKPDMKTVFLNKRFLDNNSVKSKVVPSSDGSFTYEQIIMAKKLRSIGWKNALAGGNLKDWIRSQYGVTPRLMDDMPTYIGSWSTDILFDDIRATATTQVGGDTQYLGDKASSGRGYAGGSSRRIVCDRPGYLMYMLSIVPRVDYASFVDRYAMDKKLSDLFVNELNGVGLDDMLATDLANHISPSYGDSSTPTVYPTYRSDLVDGELASDFAVAKQPAWMSYMSDVNRVNGRFYDNLAMRSWVNLREFTYTAAVTDVNERGISGVVGFGAEIRPDDWNAGFTDNSVNAENFLVQLNIEDVVRSNVAKRLMPHL
jgi:hypothetical protein